MNLLNTFDKRTKVLFRKQVKVVNDQYYVREYFIVWSESKNTSQVNKSNFVNNVSLYAMLKGISCVPIPI